MTREQISLRLPPEYLDKVEKYQYENGFTARSQALLSLLQNALNSLTDEGSVLERLKLVEAAVEELRGKVDSLAQQSGAQLRERKREGLPQTWRMLVKKLSTVAVVYDKLGHGSLRDLEDQIDRLRRREDLLIDFLSLARKFDSEVADIQFDIAAIEDALKETEDVLVQCKELLRKR